MTIKEFSEKLRISVVTARRLLRFNLVKSHKENGRRIIDETIEEYLKQYETKAKP